VVAIAAFEPNFLTFSIARSYSLPYSKSRYMMDGLIPSSASSCDSSRTNIDSLADIGVTLFHVDLFLQEGLLINLGVGRLILSFERFCMAICLNLRSCLLMINELGGISNLNDRKKYGVVDKAAILAFF
jgi:hypothetical protein